MISLPVVCYKSYACTPLRALKIARENLYKIGTKSEIILKPHLRKPPRSSINSEAYLTKKKASLSRIKYI